MSKQSVLAQIAGATEEHAEHITGHYPPNIRLPLCRAAAAVEPACCGMLRHAGSNLVETSLCAT